MLTHPSLFAVAQVKPLLISTLQGWAASYRAHDIGIHYQVRACDWVHLRTVGVSSQGCATSPACADPPCRMHPEAPGLSSRWQGARVATW